MQKKDLIKISIFLILIILSMQIVLGAFTIKENSDGAMGFYIDGVEKAFLNSTIFNISAPIYTTNVYSGGFLLEDNYIGDAQTHIAGGDLNMNQNDLTTVNQITFNNSRVNIGTSTTISNSDYTIAIGHNAESTTANSISIGNDATNSGSAGSQIAIGYFADTYNQYAIAIGRDADASGRSGIALGYATNALGNEAIAIGRDADVTGGDAIAIGYGTNASASKAVAIGYGTQNNVADSFKVGGAMTHVQFDTTLDVTGNVTSDTDFCISGGNCLSTVSSADGYIGDAQTHTAGGDLNMNQNDLTTVNQITFNNSRVNIGTSTTISNNTNTIAIGTGAVASGLNSPIAIGHLATTSTVASAIAIGRESQATGHYAVALGTYQTQATNSNALAFGRQALSSGYSSIALGYKSTSSGSSSIAIGGGPNYDINGAQAISNYAIAIGAYSVASAGAGYYPIAIGYNASATANNAIALGKDTVNNVADSFKVGGAMTHVQFDTTLDVTGNVTSDTDFCIDGGTCLSTVSSADNYIGDVQTHTAGGDLNMSGNDILDLDQLKFESNQIAIGTVTSSGTNSIAIGSNMNVAVDYGISIGGVNTVAARAIAMGVNTDASGLFSVAIGYDADATGARSVAIGGGSYSDGADASGTNSLALIELSSASANYAMAIGYNTTASAIDSIALGRNTNNAVANSLKVSGEINDVLLDTDLEVTGDINASATSGWMYFGNGGGLYWNSTHSCIVGPDGDLSKAICDVD